MEAVEAIYRNPTTYFIAAWGTGKSIAIAYAAWKMVLRWAPGVDGCFVGPTIGQLLRTLVKAWEEVADPRYYRVISSGPEPRIEWWGGTPCTIWLFTSEAEERIEGPTLGWAACEEMQDIPKSTMDRIEGRLRDASVEQPRIFGAGLPETSSWLYKDLVVHPVEGIKWIQGKSADNPHLHPKYIPTLQKKLPPNLFRSRVLGLFSSPEGLVYSTFRREIHASQPRPYAPGRKVIVGVDFNATPYIPAVLYQEHEELDETWGIGEIILKEGNTQKLAAALVEWAKDKKINWKDPNQMIVVPDASGKARSPNDGSSCHDTLMAAGLVLDCPEANPEVTARDNAVSARLQTSDGKHHLFYDPSCETAIAGYESLKNEKRKSNYYNHVLDAGGYPIHRYHPVFEGSYEELLETLQANKPTSAPTIQAPLTVRDWSHF